MNYYDIGHPADQNTILWVHNRVIKLIKEKQHPYDGLRALPTELHCSGRVDTAKKIGSISFDLCLSRDQTRRIAEDVIAKFPGIKFYVFYNDGWQAFKNGASMQKFWEATE